MKLVYVTSKSFPSGKVEPFIIKSMASAFADILGKDFTLFIRGSVPPGFEQMNTVGINLPNKLKSLSYLFYLPVWILKKQWNKEGVVFYSSDPYILSILIFWRRFFYFKYSICSEWHQLFDDWKDRYVANGSDFLVATSGTLKRFIINKCGVASGRILVPYGGINEELIDGGLKASKAEYRRRLDLPVDSFLVGYAGAYKAMDVFEKGVATMIKSLPFLDKDISMYFVGGRKIEIEEYSKLAQQEGVIDRCVFVEKQKFDRLIEYERAMDVLVIANPDTPYFRNYCFPFKSWEYLASGRPVVYSDLEIIEEIFGNKGTAFKVGDPKSLAGAIKLVRDNFEEKEGVAKSNLIELKNYTWEARAKNILNLISN